MSATSRASPVSQTIPTRTRLPSRMRWWCTALTALVLLLAVRSRAAGDARVWGAAVTLAGLTVAQVGIGVTNVLLGIPVWVSALHLGNAAAMLALALATTFRLAMFPRAEMARAARAVSQGAAS